MRIDESTLADLRRFNRKLAHAPRFAYRHLLLPLLGQALLRLSQIGADARLRRSGVRVERLVAAADDLPETPHGIIHFPTSMGRAACAHAHAWIAAWLAATAPAPQALPGA